MSKTADVDMTPAQEAGFEDHLMGNVVHSLDDIEIELAERILKLSKMINDPTLKADSSNNGTIHMIKSKIDIFKAVLNFIKFDPQMAIELSGTGGLKKLIGYVQTIARHQATMERLKEPIDAVKKSLPGHQLGELVVKAKALYPMASSGSGIALPAAFAG